MPRLGELRDYPGAERAFTRRASGRNPIALELDRLAELRGIPTPQERTQAPPGAELKREPPPFTEAELAADDDRGRREAERLDNPPNPADRARDYFQEREEREGRGGWHRENEGSSDFAPGSDYYYESLERMSPERRARFQRMEERLDRQSQQLTEWLRERPGSFHMEEGGDFFSTGQETPEERQRVQRFFDRRNRTIDYLGRLQNRARGPGPAEGYDY